MRKFLCWVGLHKWFVFYNNVPRVVQECKWCGRCRSTMYDMAYGGTYWVPGDEWSGKPHGGEKCSH